MELVEGDIRDYDTYLKCCDGIDKVWECLWNFSKHKNSVVPKFIKHAFAGEILEIYGDGNQTRDFIYIDDLIQAIMLSVKSDTGGEVFQIATYKETTVNEIADKIKTIMENEIGKK